MIDLLEKDIDSGCNHAYSEDESAINVDNNNDIVCKICGCVFNRRGKIIDKATYIDFKYNLTERKLLKASTEELHESEGAE